MKNFKQSGMAATGLALVIGFAQTAIAQDATIEVGGRLMIDYDIVDIKTPDVSVNASEVRRARLFAKGKFGDAISYKFELNHATGDDIELTDGYLQFKPEGQNLFVTVGQHRTHNSLDETTSSRFISTIERASLTDAFELNRRLGITVGALGDNYTLKAGLFGDSVSGAAFDKDGHAASARFTYLPYEFEDTLVHIGGSWRYRNGSDSQDDTVNDGLRYRQRPYAHTLGSDNTDGVLSSGRIVATPRFAKSDNLFMIEGLAIHKNMWAAAEYSILNANGAAGNADGDFSGGYIEAGYIIGGKRSYKKSAGSFDRSKVDNPVGSGGMGALALVVRYDTLDLQDGPYLGKLDTIVLGADWLPTKQTRFRINYFNSDATNGAAKSASGIAARLGFDF